MVSITFTTPGGLTEEIVLDATVRQVHRASATITEHPVEEGSNISDHIRPDLDAIRVEAVITNTPIVQPGSNMDGVTSEVAPIELDVPSPPTRFNVSGLLNAAVQAFSPKVNKAEVLQFSGPFDRIRSVYESFLSMRDNGTVVRVLTTLREYESMVIQSVEVPKDDPSDSINLNIEARQIRIVQTDTVQAPEPTQPRGRRQVSAGNQTPGDADAQTEQNASLAHRLMEGFF
jgi:hypothetical protein